MAVRKRRQPTGRGKPHQHENEKEYRPRAAFESVLNVRATADTLSRLPAWLAKKPSCWSRSLLLRSGYSSGTVNDIEEYFHASLNSRFTHSILAVLF